MNSLFLETLEKINPAYRDVRYFNCSGALVISDPCYARGTWCGIYGLPALPGTWKTTVTRYNDGQWGDRIAVLVARWDETNLRNLSSTEHSPLKIAGPSTAAVKLFDKSAGVDSGQLGIFDNRVYPSDDHPGDTPFYKTVCDMTLLNHWGVISTEKRSYGQGVVCSSGFGDGIYHVDILATEDEFAVEIMVTFIDENEEDETEDQETDI